MKEDKRGWYVENRGRGREGGSETRRRYGATPSDQVNMGGDNKGA